MKKTFRCFIACAVSAVLLAVSPLSINVQEAFIRHPLPNCTCYVQIGNNCWVYTIYYILW